MSEKSKMVPELRFPEFDGEWEEKKLNQIAKKITNKNTKLQIDKVISNSAKFGLVDQKEYFDKDIANKENLNGYIIIKKNDFVYNPRMSNESPFGPINMYKYDEIGIVSPLYTCFRISNGDFRFFDKYFRSNKWNRFVYMNGDSGARHDRVAIRDEVFFRMPLCVPTISEQQKIATFLSLIDKKIELLEKKVELLEEQKRGLLQKIFSQEIRFKKDDGSEFEEWEYKTVGDIVGYEQPTKYLVKSTEYSNDHTIPVLTANKSFILGYTNEKNGIYDKGAVIIFDDFTNDFKFVDFPFKVKSSAIKILYAKENDIRFIFYLFSQLKFPSLGHKRHFLSIVYNLDILVPNIYEQIKIKEFFSKHDFLIVKTKKKLANSTKLKKSLLQKIFI